MKTIYRNPNRRGIMDTLIDCLNEAEQEKPEDERGEWKRLHSTPQEIITVRGVGNIMRPVTVNKGE